MSKKLVSLVVPAYREESNIPFFYDELKSIIKWVDKKYDFELIFVNDGSPDDSWSIIAGLSKKDRLVKWVNLSRNFGKEIAITAWLEYAKWNAIITLDADLQHPIDKIPVFLEKWEEWYDIVYNKRPTIKWASRFKRFSSKVFYFIFNMISDFKLEWSTTDYRLLDRKVVDVFLKLRERNRIYRWLIDWLWFNKIALVFDANKARDGRKSSYNYLKLYKLAIDSITSFSIMPLKLVWYLWFFITFSGVSLFFIMILDKFIYDMFNFSSIAFVVVFNTILIGIVLMSLWMMALYIAKIHEEVMGRPLYVVKETINFK